MEGKKKKRAGLLIAKPDYKKAYVTLKNPLSLSRDLFPIRVVEEEKERVNKKEKPTSVGEGEGKKHWLDRKDAETVGEEKGSAGERSGRRRFIGDAGAAKFPWSSMLGSW